MSKENFLVSFKKQGNILVPAGAIMRDRFNEMVRLAPEGANIQALFTIEVVDGTKAQLAKIHAMINDIAAETGESPENIKKQIKADAGLTYRDGNEIRYNSFGKCSVDTLSKVIEILYVRGEFLSINFRAQY